MPFQNLNEIHISTSANIMYNIYKLPKRSFKRCKFRGHHNFRIAHATPSTFGYRLQKNCFLLKKIAVQSEFQDFSGVFFLREKKMPSSMSSALPT
jgi:hypothetical protein